MEAKNPIQHFLFCSGNSFMSGKVLLKNINFYSGMVWVSYRNRARLKYGSNLGSVKHPPFPTMRNCMFYRTGPYLGSTGHLQLGMATHMSCPQICGYCSRNFQLKPYQQVSCKHSGTKAGEQFSLNVYFKLRKKGEGGELSCR